jgi:hypothetical protein
LTRFFVFSLAGVFFRAVFRAVLTAGRFFLVLDLVLMKGLRTVLVAVTAAAWARGDVVKKERV